jgi:dTDP-4-dehydrorhamnose reductase
MILGGGGQLATDLAPLWPDARVLAHRELDVCDPGAVASVIRSRRPQVVVNTAAFNQVDRAETEPAAGLQAFATNAIATVALARACRDAGAWLIHCSTDYVFDGRARDPYREDARPAPLSVYGCSKLAGEVLVAASGARHVIVRSSGLYGLAGSRAKGGNFASAILRRAERGEPLRVVNDQVCAPTFTPDLARAIHALATRLEDDPGRGGVYHVTNSGRTTWYEFARTLLALRAISVSIEGISSEEYGAPARRPAYSILDNRRLQELGIEQPRPIEAALADYVRALGDSPVSAS